MSKGILEVNGVGTEDYTDWEGEKVLSKAVKEHCKECMGGVASEVKFCTSMTCLLRPFRTGKNPFRAERVYTDDQRIEMKERMKKIRKGD